MKPTTKKELQTPKENSIASLKKIMGAAGIKKDTVYSVINHVSQSGMSREISFYLAGKNGITCINWYIKEILGYKFGKRGLRISGCGMDMGFAVVYNLSRKLYPNGFKVKGRGRNGDTSGWDKDGGYKLNQQWI